MLCCWCIVNGQLGTCYAHVFGIRIGDNLKETLVGLWDDGGMLLLKWIIEQQFQNLTNTISKDIHL